jgi:long-chain acyl-CoA synthetase
MLNLAVMLEDSADRVPERVAVACGGTRLTYAQVNDEANRVANLLVDCGVQPGDRVALSCPNVPAFPIVYYGILKAGAVAVPLNTTLNSREIAYHLTDSGATVYLCHEDIPDLPIGTEGHLAYRSTPTCRHFFTINTNRPLRPPTGRSTLDAALHDKPPQFNTRATAPSDTAVILYTSGTTGQPKGARLSHANMVLNALTCHRLFGTIDHETHLAALPLYGSFAQTIHLNAGFGAAATLVLLPRFTATATLHLLHQEHVTFFAAVPTMYWALLHTSQNPPPDTPHELPVTLRMAISGGEPLPPTLHQQIHDTLGLQIHEGYGLTETSPLATFNHPDHPTKPGSIGKPIWGIQLKLIDNDWNTQPNGEVGEIAIRGHNTMTAYHNNPTATTHTLNNGWLRTGDIARRDPDGNYYILDRTQDIIVRGGFNIYPREIEETLTTHPDITHAAVIGIPHHTHGQEIKACIIAKPNVHLTETQLITWCKQQMANYKYPRIIEFRTTLPTTPTGKILKRELRDSHIRAEGAA